MKKILVAVLLLMACNKNAPHPGSASGTSSEASYVTAILYDSGGKVFDSTLVFYYYDGSGNNTSQSSYAYTNQTLIVSDTTLITVSGDKITATISSLGTTATETYYLNASGRADSLVTVEPGLNPVVQRYTYDANGYQVRNVTLSYVNGVLTPQTAITSVISNGNPVVVSDSNLKTHQLIQLDSTTYDPATPTDAALIDWDYVETHEILGKWAANAELLDHTIRPGQPDQVITFQTTRDSQGRPLDGKQFVNGVLFSETRWVYK